MLYGNDEDLTRSLVAQATRRMDGRSVLYDSMVDTCSLSAAARPSRLYNAASQRRKRINARRRKRRRRRKGRRGGNERVLRASSPVICNSQVGSEEMQDTGKIYWREARRRLSVVFASDVPMSCVTLTRGNLEPPDAILCAVRRPGAPAV